MATRAESVFAVIVAAGGGTRMGGVSKPLIKLGKKTLFEYVLQAFCDSEAEKITVVCTPGNAQALKELAAGDSKPVEFTFGGETRADSVFNGVKKCGKCGYAVVHDCARPFVTPEIIASVIAGAKETGVSTACTQVTDTVKYVDAENGVIYTPERKNLLAIQTPQCFAYPLYLPAYLLAKSQKHEYTDETSMLEAAGAKVKYVICDASNIKLTTKADVMTARAIRLIKEHDNNDKNGTGV
ncbi:MAG: 2-C-methyl-D-erythritol 4-phosphate cytidylyltransferase [Clostridia bacterium]|nr:2-C-methyl-D-erythritol 4-phosphate cytidylyltransferase [Clostridia bacterium]